MNAIKRARLAIKKKKDAISGRIRISIISRMSFHYFKLLLIHGVLFFLIVLLLYLQFVKKPLHAEAETYLVSLETRFLEVSSEGGATYLNQLTKPSVNENISMTIYTADETMVLYHDRVYELRKLFGLIPSLHISLRDKAHRLVVTERMKLHLGDEIFLIDFYYNMTDLLAQAKGLFLSIVLVYFVLVFFVLLGAKRMNRQLFEPVKKMSYTLERLTVGNLNSERLDIGGTNNELKDLAIVCNEMLDRLQGAYATQKEFVSNASHELRTPIAVIQGYSNLLQRWGLKNPEVLEESVDAIHSEAKAMQELVEKLLFLSRHDKGTLKLKKEWFQIKPMVEELLHETRLTVGEQRRIENPALEEVEVYGDRQSLKQAMRVLIENAIKYTEDGDTISIACYNRRGACELSVEDTGIGMKRKDVDNIFNRFYRADDVRDRNISGHGLGLSIAKLIILSHTGRIRIRSQYMTGTKFTILLPRYRRVERRLSEEAEKRKGYSKSAQQDNEPEDTKKDK